MRGVQRPALPLPSRELAAWSCGLAAPATHDRHRRRQRQKLYRVSALPGGALDALRGHFWAFYERCVLHNGNRGAQYASHLSVARAGARKRPDASCVARESVHHTAALLRLDQPFALARRKDVVHCTCIVHDLHTPLAAPRPSPPLYVEHGLAGLRVLYARDRPHLIRVPLVSDLARKRYT